VIAKSADLRERVEALPGMHRLLPALRGLAPAYLVGGAVRDILRGSSSVDLDLAVEGDALAQARTLAERLGGTAVEHERFGTATVKADGLALDLAATRRETYPAPGALPLVEPASLGDDLARRDFTVNAMAVDLSGAEVGRLRGGNAGLRDLEAGTVRVLHDASFVDDPTRLLRALRYECRLGFRMDPHTEALAGEAVRAEAPATVSGPRVRDELLDLLAEAEFAAGLERMRALGLDRALHPALDAAPELAAGAALGAAGTGADRLLAALAALVAGAPDELVPWLDRLGLAAGPRERVARAARNARGIASTLHERSPAPSELYALLTPEPPETLALALALGAPGEPILRFAADLRHVRLDISGDDLVGAGVAQSPAIGRALEATLRRKLDGELQGRDEELRAALQAAEGRS